MGLLAIIQPMAIAAIGGSLENVGRLLTAPPKEAAVTTGGARTIDFDLGSARSIDTIMLGHTNGVSAASFTASYGTAAYTTTALPNLVNAHSRGADGLVKRHFIAVYDAPITARYIRLSVAALPAGFYAGTMIVGKAIRPQYGHEYGGGRSVTDTGSVTQLVGGGFGVSEGARVGGWQWTMGDLTDAETDALYIMQLLVGTTKPIVVVEEPSSADGLNERVHYGLLSRLEAYERRESADTKWSMRINQWG